jgi:hypothetical protein
MTTSEHPWMEHDQTGHRAQLPDEPYWRAQGWSPVDGPHPEPDRYHDPEPEPPAVEAEPESETKSTKRAAKSAPSEEGNVDG